MAGHTNKHNLTNEDLKLKNINNLKKCYKKYIRNDFLESFEPLYCKSMNDQFLNKILKTYCGHENTNKEINLKHYELMMYVKNIIAWLDPKMDYYDGSITKSISKYESFKTCYIHDEEHISRICLQNKSIETLEKNELPLANTLKHQINDIPSTNYTKTRCPQSSKDFVINNSQDNVIFVDSKIKNVDLDNSSKIEIEEPFMNNSPEYNMHSVDTFKNNNENVIKYSEEEEEEVISKVSKEFMINNSQNNIKLKNIVTKNVDSGNNTKNKNESLTNNSAEENIDLDDNSKNNNENLIKYFEKEELIFNKVSKDFVINNLQNNIKLKNIQNKNIDTISNTNNKNESLTNNSTEENMNSDDNSKNNYENFNNNPEEDINMIFKNMENNISHVMETSLEMINSEDISNNVKKENTNTSLIVSSIKEKSSKPKSSKNNVTAIIEEKLDPDQSSYENGNNENILDVCLETSSTTDEQHLNCANELSNIKSKFHKRTKKTLDKSFTRSKRCNLATTDSEYISKKKKIENLSISHTVQNNIHDVCNSKKTSNDSTKKADKNMYSRNTKGETKLHAACAKGKLDLVTLLLVNGFNPNVKDNAGWTPLHEAVKNGHFHIVKKLIDYGAFLNVPGFEYESPLYTAIKYDQFDIALMLFQNGADIKCINMYGISAQSINEEKCLQLIKSQIPCLPSRTKYVYEPDQIIIFTFNVSLKNDIVKQFCQQFNIKVVQNILSEKEFKQVTHIILPETKDNTCDVSVVILIGIANGLFIVNQKWISDSLKQNKLLSCENYEVSGTNTFVNYNGPKMSRINKQNLCPKLFDGICIYVSGNIGWKSFSLEQLKKLIVAFGAKLLTRMPNPESCPTNIIPYHCRNNKDMYHVSNIILFTMDSSRLIKYNMKHLKTLPISWFMEAVQKYTIT